MVTLEENVVFKLYLTFIDIKGFAAPNYAYASYVDNKNENFIRP